MKNLLLATTSVATLQLSFANDAEAARVKEVNFESNNQNLVGDLYLPDNDDKLNKSENCQLLHTVFG